MQQTFSKFTAGNIDKEDLINTLHAIFTQNLQKVATSTLGKLKFHHPLTRIKTESHHNPWVNVLNWTPQQ
jgi:hypothetical protein